jgi:paraquat-inducible protein A
LPYTLSATAHHIACHDCDLLQQLPPLLEGESAFCPRCDALLYKRKINSFDRSMALALAGLMLFILANIFPFLSLNAKGQIQDSTLISGALAMLNAERPFLAFLVFMTTFTFPLFDLLGTLYILFAIRAGRTTQTLRYLFRFLQSVNPWGMLEVFMLGVLVAVVKLGDLATIVPGIAMYSFALLILILAALAASLDPHAIWNKLYADE